jgi:predicted Rossmann-fold nucleotide-binding protein
VSGALVVLVCGGRAYTDDGAIFRALDRLHDERGIRRVVTGGATGADTLAARWANEQGVSLGVYPADWHAHGKAAGQIRNQQMLDSEAPDLVLAFPGGHGTADMVRRAKRAGAWVTMYTDHPHPAPPRRRDPAPEG